MNKIHKVIPMEVLRSRLSSIVPAYDISGTCHNFTDHTTYPYSNYGMIPCDVIFNGNKISFSTLSKYYHLFLQYKNYNLHEILDENEINELCQYIDKDYINNENINDLKNFVLNKCFPTFFFQQDQPYTKEWESEYLSYNDVIYWLKWLQQHKKCDFESQLKKTDCCDCEKYNKLGGEIIIGHLENFLYSIERFNDGEYEVSSFHIPININNSIDDLGIITPIIGNNYNDGDINNNLTLISGVTSSKLSLFLKEQILVNDNLGNQFFGCYQKQYNDKQEFIGYMDIHQDYKLVLPYEEKMVTNLEIVNESKNLYWGNIIESCNNGTIVYYIGTLIIKENNSYEVYKEGKLFYGIKYTDVYTLREVTSNYFKNNTHSFKIRYDELIPTYITYKNQNYNINNLKDIKSTFEYYYPLKLEEDFYNNTTISESSVSYLREEYNIGKSTIEKIDDNIYIDRGNCRVFDPHLRLLEVKSLESLEQTGNGFFNII